MSEKNNVRPFGFKDKIGYMFGDFGNDFTFILSSSFMLKFYTDVMGIHAAVVGVLMMAARFVDAFTDVAMGQIVDRSKPTKDGKFKPWLRRMCGPVAISSFLVFQSGFANMPYLFKVVWMIVTYIYGEVFSILQSIFLMVQWLLRFQQMQKIVQVYQLGGQSVPH